MSCYREIIYLCVLLGLAFSIQGIPAIESYSEKPPLSVFELESILISDDTFLDTMEVNLESNYPHSINLQTFITPDIEKVWVEVVIKAKPLKEDTFESYINSIFIDLGGIKHEERVIRSFDGSTFQTISFSVDLIEPNTRHIESLKIQLNADTYPVSYCIQSIKLYNPL